MLKKINETKTILWLTGLLFFIVNFVTLKDGHNWGDDFAQSTASFLFMIHKSVGLVLLFWMVAWTVFRIQITRPVWPLTMPVWEQVVAACAHFLLYAGMWTMALTGWFFSTAAGRPPVFFTLFTWPMPGVPLSDIWAHRVRDIHEIVAWCLVALVALHTLAALKHHFWNRDFVLKRMMGRYP